MRLFLVIPAFVLLLSNIPFIKVMDMETVRVCLKSILEKTCAKQAAEKVKSHCQKDALNSSCRQSRTKAEPATDIPAGKPAGCVPSETSCVCICGFQILAPLVGDKLTSVHWEEITASYSSFRDISWQDPLLAMPVQPPDWAV
ncbi:MAG: hypothetical protein H7Y27_09480 [Gemmatimonadaceae bacterium]|nr:hypothetical protein [Chitinophagaceae bacterium]